MTPTVPHVSPLVLYISNTTDQMSEKCFFDAGRAIEPDQFDSQEQTLAVDGLATKRQADAIYAQIRSG